MNDYASVAPFYDFLLYPFVRSIRGDVLKMVVRLRPEYVVDVACGTGNQLRLLKKKGIDGICLDRSASMLGVAQKGISAPQCLRQDASAMGIADSSVDLSMISFALHETEWSEADRITDEIHRILKTGGHLLVVDYETNGRAWFLAKKLVDRIEYLAGERHYGNFRIYNRNGGIDSLIDSNRFELVHQHHRGRQTVAIKLFKKKEPRKSALQ